MSILAIVGTAKGAFLLRSNERRERWTLEGPLFKGWKATAAARDHRGRYFIAIASDVYGAALQMSIDLEQWRQIDNGPSYPKGGPRKLNQIWKIFAGKDSLYAGVDEAGLFRSDDGGETWRPVEGLNEHPTRSAWQPGAGGLCAHAILSDPRDPRRMWCGISAVGVFRTDDGGRTWTSKNQGVRVVVEDKEHKDVGYCVHGLVQDPSNADTIYRQDHAGMYRTNNRGDTWEKNEDGLPSGFGFPIVIDPLTRSLFAAPLVSDEDRVMPEGRLRVYRSRNGGDSWEPAASGLPQEHVYTGVLRGAMAVDGLDPCGVYLGTTSGTIHISSDLGTKWTSLPYILPRVLSVSVFIES